MEKTIERANLSRFKRGDNEFGVLRVVVDGVEFSTVIGPPGTWWRNGRQVERAAIDILNGDTSGVPEIIQLAWKAWDTVQPVELQPNQPATTADNEGTEVPQF